MDTTGKTLVLGIGNELMSDDGVGAKAVLRLAHQTRHLSGVSCLDGGTLGHLLVGYIEASDHLIVVDAAQMHERPGSVRVFENGDMDRFLSANPNRSVHEVGLSDLMAMALLGDHLPKRRALIAIQPQDTDWGMELSGPVLQSLPLVCEKALELIECWRGSVTL
jgi:hydrogenase maturation protease